MRHITIRRVALSMAWALAGLLALSFAPAGNGVKREGATGGYANYMPFVTLPELPCDSSAIAQLRSVATWQGEFSMTFSASASGPWPSGDTESVSVSRTMRFPNVSLVKNFDSATFVRWKIPVLIDTGQLTADDRDDYTFAGGGVSTKSAQFTADASADVMSIQLYPDQCKLRFFLDGQAIGPVVGDITPNNSFYFCATIDVPSPGSGAQAFSSSLPIYLGSADVSASDDARRAGLGCRVGGGGQGIGPDLFTPRLAWVLDGGTTSGARGRGDAPLGNALVSFRFAPQP